MSRFAGRHAGHRPPWDHAGMPGAEMAHGGYFLPLDVDGDGKITKDEVLKMYAMVDKDGDGSVTREDFIKEIIAAAKAKSSAEKTTTPDAAKNPANAPADGSPAAGGGPPRPPRSRFGGPRIFGGGHPSDNATALFGRFDKDQKGKLTKDNVPAPLWERISPADADHDGSVSKDELETYFKNRSRRNESDSPSKTNQKPADDQPKDKKPEDSKPTAQAPDLEKPADATAAANITVAT